MNNKRAYMTIVYGLIVVITYLVIILLFTGCSSRRYIRESFDPAGNLKERIEIKAEQFILKSKLEQIYARTDKTGKEFSVGEVNQTPDADSVKAITEGVITGLRKGAVGL